MNPAIRVQISVGPKEAYFGISITQDYQWISKSYVFQPVSESFPILWIHGLNLSMVSWESLIKILQLDGGQNHSEGHRDDDWKHDSLYNLKW